MSSQCERTTWIEFRTTSEARRLLERAVQASGSNLTDFAESCLLLAERRVMAGREHFLLSERAAAAWEAINSRPLDHCELPWCWLQDGGRPLRRGGRGLAALARQAS